MLNLIDQPGGKVWVAKAPNWANKDSKDPLNIGISTEGIKARADRGLRFIIGQMYGVLGPGMIHAEHVFQGLSRGMTVGDDSFAASRKLAVTWKAKRDAVFVGDRFEGSLKYMDAPKARVFAVYVSPNDMLEKFPDIYGWAEHWTWIAADPALSGAPVDWDGRYDSKIWPTDIEE